MGFRNSILAGMTLIREAIRSQNYEQGVQGWSINADGTAEFGDLTIRSSDGSGATAEIENGKAIFTAATGWQIIIDPTNEVPVIYFVDGLGAEASAINASGVNSRPGLVLSSGNFEDGAIDDWRWTQIMGESTSNNRYVVQRLRNSDETFSQGGWLFLDPTIAQLGVNDSEDSTNNTLFQAGSHIFIMDRGRLVVGPPPSTQPAILVNVEEVGHTGALLHLMREGMARLIVDEDGNVSAAGDVTAANIRAGQASTPAPGAGGGTSEVSVVFSSPMSAVPMMSITPRSTVDPETVDIKGYVDDVTASGFTIRAYRSTNSATTWSYQAIVPA